MESSKVPLSLIWLSAMVCFSFAKSLGNTGDLPMQNPDLFEGDIVGISGHEDRNAVREESKLWPDGRIPYFFDTYTTYDESQKEMILNAMKEYETLTCIKFEPLAEITDEVKDYVLIFAGRGCYSNVGRKGGIQTLSLSSGCFQLPTIIHELGHTIGFYHEHTRSDRDDYITIHWSNIMESAKDQFYKLLPSQNRLLDLFDYDSIMLYGERTFSKDGWSKTMTAKEKGVKLVDVYDKKGLSQSDIKRVRKLYECP